MHTYVYVYAYKRTYVVVWKNQNEFEPTPKTFGQISNPNPNCQLSINSSLVHRHAHSYVH